MSKPLIVGIGGTPKPGSTTEQALRLALDAAAAAGADTQLFGGNHLAALPLYLTEGSDTAGAEMIAAIRKADGIILATPGYHGTISGAVKNAIDYIEETARDARVYLDGLPVGLIVTAYGWQATGSTLATMRSIVHALRGWPTPLGAAINTSGGIFTDGECTDPAAANQLAMVGRQVMTFARLHQVDPTATETV
ncbi:NADPH-dependent FMN reductase [Sphingomonas solaris]|uniref:NAD(P)H-dependent oxidoreductase n=1 Tax=Alterirhizorhabdus solaris TaxID=2529389 RepID=A0A558QRL5_9SPHN|nr:NADPH-dependent FMN reductase [Sphingomonas solaris]TVV69759.1 NAD(P)H-dependent oxidoreductase [Sphingomonas solaris]